VSNLMRSAAVLLLLLPLAARAAQKTADGGPSETAKPAATWEPTDRYEERTIEGWRVLVNKGFIKDQPTLCDQALTLLRFQLYQIPRKVPAPAVAKLRKVTIWVEEKEPHHPCMAYHPSSGWLRNHNMNPDKGRCVELANARNFLAWTRQQPWMVLHELSHAYHDQFLPGGHGNPEIRAAYERAKKEKLYDSVLRYNATTGRAYAMNNPMEYFAETTEAFFGTNDFFPFVNAELRTHDPKMHELLRKIWSGQIAKGKGEK